LFVELFGSLVIVAQNSAPDNRYGRQTLLENSVYDRLNALGGADT